MGLRSSLFVKPEGGWIGDVIPFYDQGAFWLFYLHERRPGEQDGAEFGTAWHLLRTTDLVSFEDYGEVLPAGGASEPDFNAYTGSVLKHAGRYHLFYTGQNPRIVRDGAPLQAVMHAVSDDLVTWKKLPDETFHADESMYEVHDWRDPHVFQDPRGGGFGMLLAARRRTGSDRRRGCIGWCWSDDLHGWTVGEPFWAPGLYTTHECPDLFRIGDWWYLVYSEFSERFTTRYRMARDLDGPWEAPSEDALDGRAFYAAKIASDGYRHYAFGWVPSREEATDEGHWQWAGNLSVHELVQRGDGTLDVRLPAARRDVFTRRTPASFVTTSSTDGHGTLELDGRGTHVSALAESLPEQCLLTGTISFEAGTRGVGLLLNVGPDPDTGYIIRLEPARNRLVFDRWPRGSTGPEQWQIAGDVPFAVELERAIQLDPARDHTIEVLLEGTICTTYLDGRVAMSARIYDRRGDRWGAFVQEGRATFRELDVRTR